jgi:bifunctional non-homologous end joining protein LigD
MKIGKRDIELSNTEKALFDDAGITKGDMIDYYREMASVMLPHVRDRALTLHRFPDGIRAKGFYQQNVSDYFPDWIARATLGKGSETEYPVVTDTPSLVYLANQAAIEFHVWLSRVDRPDHPDRMIFDLDPAGEDFSTVRFAASQLHELLVQELGLPCFAMTTGSRGLHLVVPLDPTSNFDSVRGFARRIAEIAVTRAPDRPTTEQRKDKRGDRLFLDTTRNAYGQTGIAPYSLRAKPGGPLATPLEWKEVDDSTLRADRYTLENIRRRLGQRSDPWRHIKRHAVKIASHRKQLDHLR